MYFFQHDQSSEKRCHISSRRRNVARTSQHLHQDHAKEWQIQATHIMTSQILKQIFFKESYFLRMKNYVSVWIVCDVSCECTLTGSLQMEARWTKRKLKLTRNFYRKWKNSRSRKLDILPWSNHNIHYNSPFDPLVYQT